MLDTPQDLSGPEVATLDRQAIMIPYAVLSPTSLEAQRAEMNRCLHGWHRCSNLDGDPCSRSLPVLWSLLESEREHPAHYGQTSPAAASLFAASGAHGVDNNELRAAHRFPTRDKFHRSQAPGKQLPLGRPVPVPGNARAASRAHVLTNGDRSVEDFVTADAVHVTQIVAAVRHGREERTGLLLLLGVHRVQPLRNLHAHVHCGTACGRAPDSIRVGARTRTCMTAS